MTKENIETPEQKTEQKERIAKRIARSGYCSRRDAEKWIEAGRVKVNGKLIDSPALNVGSTDKIEIDGKPIQEPERTRLWRYYKPTGLVTSNKDEKGRAVIFDHLPKTMPRVMTVGRLDMNSEGLLLLTNNGELARFLELPSTGWSRRYKVRIYGAIPEDASDRLAEGMLVDGVQYGPIEMITQSRQGANSWVLVTLKEGKNREIRKVMAALGLEVNRLIRLSYGPFQLGNLERGHIEEVTGKVMREQLKDFFADKEPEQIRKPWK